MRTKCGLLLGWVLVSAVNLPSAEEPLHARIDRLIAAKFEGQAPAPPADDAAFLRRLSLDLAGVIPSADEVRRFVNDSAQDKRSKRIDQLLAAPSYPERMEELFHVMLMERRGEDALWRNYLKSSFAANKPWNQMAGEILRAADQDASQQGAGFFYTKRLENYGENPVDYPGLTRDVGRLFLGVDLQCAECHNHLFIEDYKQHDFQGLFAVYQNLSIRKGVKFPAVTEKEMTAKLEFVSVFDPTQRQTGPRVPFGKEFSLPIPEPPETNPKDKKARGKKPVPQSPEELPFSALIVLAEELSSPENKWFTRNAVNRLWWVMLGRGLVEPLDQFHSDNPPTHPELLDLLAREFAAHQFDVKWLLRELALSETYQRGGVIPQDQPPPRTASYLVANEKRLSARQLLFSTLKATGNLERYQQPEAGKPSKAFSELEAGFLAAFANEPREPEIDYTASVKGALFLLNDEQLLSLLKPEANNLIERLMKLTEEQPFIEELFLSTFARQPSDEERAAVLEYLKKNHARREAAIGHVVWSMITSMEFAVNH